MSKLKAVLVKFCHKVASDTLSTEKDFNEKACRVVRGFINLG